MPSALTLGGAALRWALRFYASHFWLVFGLSLVPTVQRFLVIRFDPPAAISWSSEALTMAARLLLVYLVVRLMAAEFAPRSASDRWNLFTAGVSLRLRAFLLQFVLLGIAFVIFDVVPGLLISELVAQDRQDLWRSVLVSAKNPTVIAMTILWMVGVGRTLMRSSLAATPYASA
jgi:hypothetical protein